jgi:hypothetical protein
MVKMFAHQFRRTPQSSAIDVSRNPLHVVEVFVASRRGNLQQYGQLAGNHKVTRRGRGKDEPAATFAVLERELLRDCASPRYTQHVHLVVTKLVKQPRAQPCQRIWTIGPPRCRRAPYSRHVEDNGLRAIQRVEKRLDQLYVRADSVE